MCRIFVKIVVSISIFLSCWFGWNLSFSASNTISTFDGNVMTIDYHIMVAAAQNDSYQACRYPQVLI